MSSQVINNRDQRVGTAINMGLISSFANSTTTNAGTVVIGNNGYMNGVRKVV